MSHYAPTRTGDPSPSPEEEKSGGQVYVGFPRDFETTHDAPSLLETWYAAGQWPQPPTSNHDPFEHSAEDGGFSELAKHGSSCRSVTSGGSSGHSACSTGSALARAVSHIRQRVSSSNQNADNFCNDVMPSTALNLHDDEHQDHTGDSSPWKTPPLFPSTSTESSYVSTGGDDEESWHSQQFTTPIVGSSAGSSSSGGRPRSNPVSSQEPTSMLPSTIMCDEFLSHPWGTTPHEAGLPERFQRMVDDVDVSVSGSHVSREADDDDIEIISTNEVVCTTPNGSGIDRARRSLFTLRPRAALLSSLSRVFQRQSRSSAPRPRTQADIINAWDEAIIQSMMNDEASSRDSRGR